VCLITVYTVQHHHLATVYAVQQEYIIGVYTALHQHDDGDDDDVCAELGTK
jgi:hypothetical protein